jgi:hypothetical protein
VDTDLPIPSVQSLASGGAAEFLLSAARAMRGLAHTTKTCRSLTCTPGGLKAILTDALSRIWRGGEEAGPPPSQTAYRSRRFLGPPKTFPCPRASIVEGWDSLWRPLKPMKDRAASRRADSS